MLDDKEKSYLKKIYKGRKCIEITQMINAKFGTNHTVTEIEGFKCRHHLKSGLDCTFKKGQVPANKGKKWNDYMAKEQQARARKTCFKKGNIPKQHRQVGEERITVDGYLEIKIAEPNKWVLKHRLVYEEAYGKIPKGMNLIFADGNKLNLELDNLLLVTDNELLRMNRNNLIKEDKDLTKSGLALTKLMNKMYENGLAKMNYKEYQKKYTKEHKNKIKEYAKKYYQKRKGVSHERI